MKRDQANAVIEKTSSVGVLAENYRQDLDMLKILSPVLVTQADMDMLATLAAKYGIGQDVSRANFVKVLGSVSCMVREKLEKLAIDYELNSVREETIERMPKQDTARRTKTPEVFDK
jgi:hypothetical protein